MKNMKKLTRLLALVLAAVLVLSLLPSAFAAEPPASLVTVKIAGTRNWDMISPISRKINEKRGERLTEPLTLDEDLTLYAMRRAAELSVRYGSTRPDGTEAENECIFFGRRSADLAAKAWIRDPADRRLLLNPEFTHMGVGSFTTGEITYFCVVFAAKDTPAAQFPDAEQVIDFPVNTLPENLDLYLNTQVEPLELTVGKQAVHPVYLRSRNKTVPVASAVLVPLAADAIDAGEVPVASVSAMPDGVGLSYTGLQAGTGYSAVRAWAGQEKPVYLQVNVADNTPVRPQPGEFTDVIPGSYYYDAVEWAVKTDVTHGTGPDTFSPNAFCTRAEAVTFLWRAAGKPQPRLSRMPFIDVSEDDYYHDAVLWAVENGITLGTTPLTFSPGRVCTRAQIVSFLWRAARCPLTAEEIPFADVSATAYYAGAVRWAVRNGITNGTSPITFSPDDSCTRAQIVTFLYRDLG